MSYLNHSVAIDAATEERRPLMRLAALSFVTGLSGAVMPGPLLVLGIEQTLARGVSAMAWLIAGHALLELLLVVLLVLGLRWVLQRPRVRAGAGIIGGAALVFMAAQMLWSATAVRLELSGDGTAMKMAPTLVVLGALISLANPYFTGWWATIGVGQLAHMAPRSLREYGAFYLGHEASDFAWYLFVGLLIVSGRHWLTPALYSGLVIACGLVLLALAAWFLYTGATLLRRENARARR